MNNQSEIPTLDQVLFEFMTENENPTREALTEWVHRYPQYERELVDLAVDWFQMSLPLSSGSPVENEEAVVARGVDYVHQFLLEEEAHRQMLPKTSRPFLGFIKEAKDLHISLDEFAERIGLTPALLAAIDQRMMRYASLPAELIQGLVDIVGMELPTGRLYLQTQQAISGAQRFKSDQTPQVSEQVDFFDEVRVDPDLTEEQRQRWLALEPKH
jgi:hypothetical protein